MKRAQKFIVGLVLGLISTVGLSTVIPNDAYADWILRCYTGSTAGDYICCSVDSGSGQIGSCVTITGGGS